MEPKMNNDERKCGLDDNEHVNRTKSCSSIPQKCNHLETEIQNAQCCMQCNSNKPRNKFSWRRLLSYLPSWMKNVNSAGPVAAVEAATAAATAATAKRNSPVQVCLAQARTPTQSGKKRKDQEGTERTSLIKKPSHERVIGNYNFEDGLSNKKTCCERCKQKGRSECGKHSFTRASASNKNTKPIQIGVAEVSSHKGAKGKTSNRSCACSKKEAQKSLIRMVSNPNCCAEMCKEKQPNTNSTCQESLLEQAWAYLQSLISAHKSGCQRCNQKRSCPGINSNTSNDSSPCKDSLLSLARAYLNKITSDHKSACTHCQQKPSCRNPKETTSCLKNMLEQAWQYIKKFGSEQKTCCQRCKQKGKLVCCKHSSTTQPEVNKNPGILKYPTADSKCCCQDSIQECPKQPYPADDVHTDPCPATCEPVQPVPCCRPAQEASHEHRSCYTPCCQHSSHDAQPVFTGSHQKSCCLSHSVDEHQELSYTGPSKTPSVQSVEEPNDYDIVYDTTLPCDKNSLRIHVSREILGYHSSAECSGPCAKKKSDDVPPKQGLSLTMEPNDHKFCTKPQECKHSKESIEDKQSPSGSSCSTECPGACNPKEEPTHEEKTTPPTSGPSCEGGCAKCNSQAYVAAAAPIYKEQRMVDAEYEAFLDEKYGRMVAKQLHDKETICKNNCNCMTCIEAIKNSKGPQGSNNAKHNADPHHYRYYY